MVFSKNLKAKGVMIKEIRNIYFLCRLILLK